MAINENYTLIIKLKDMSESADIFTYISSKSSVESISVQRVAEGNTTQNSSAMNEANPPLFPGEISQAVLRQLGVLPSLNGYTFLTEAIKYEVVLNETNISITKCIYPYIAKKYNSSVAKVERSIRHAIEASWKNTDIAAFEPYFGSNIAKKPTNAQFISSIAEYIKEKEPAYTEYLRRLSHE